MRGLRSSLLVVVAATFTLAGCDQASQPTRPDSSEPTAARGGGPAVPAASCDATVTSGGSIQAAVDAASSGDVVCVESGTYTEQVVINKDLTLKGLGDPVLQPPADPDDYTIAESGPTWEPILFVYGGTASGGSVSNVSGSSTVKVDVQGFVVDGLDRQPNVRRSVGIFLRNVEGSVSDNVVRNMGVGGKETMGILAYGDSRVRIVGNEVSDYERGGIGANGDGGAHPAPQVIIADNDITGSTGIGEAWAPNGIQVGFGAIGRIEHNVVRDNRWAGDRDAPWSASCILVFESDGVQIQRNTLENCDVGIGVSAWGWFLPSADNVKSQGNSITDAFAAISYQAVAWSGFSTSDASVSNGKIVNNDLFGGSIGVIGIALTAVDADPTYDAFADNNKLINNSINGFTTPILDGGTNSKVHANGPATP